MRLLLPFALACLACLACVLAPARAAPAPGPECDAQLQTHRESDLALGWIAFDQTPQSGWRALADAGCLAEAADLIEDWIAAHGELHVSLPWHIAQLRAQAGETDAAIRAARRALRDENRGLSGEDAFRWNDYVLATVAFLQKDRAAFDAHRKEVADAENLHRGNAVNLVMLDRLAAHFDASYAEALNAGADTTSEDAPGRAGGSQRS